MNCLFCKVNAKTISYKNELTTKECFNLLDDISDNFGSMINFTGGDPLERKDLFQLAKYGKDLGLHMSVSTCAHSLIEENVKRLFDAGIALTTITLHGMNEKTHEAITGLEGSFDSVLKAIDTCNRVGMPFMIVTTVVKRNYKEVPSILDFILQSGAIGFLIFFFIEIGRGSGFSDISIPPDECERMLHWVHDFRKRNTDLFSGVVGAPYYPRIINELHCKKENNSSNNVSFFNVFQNESILAGCNGCSCGKHFIFVSHTGKVQPCGLLEKDCGNIRKNLLSSIWKTSNILQELRDPDKRKGKCSICSYRHLCGGCRSRAYLETDDYLEEDPYCVYKQSPK
jgi:radical SAM protein with 4Fe4S-binding SPASM domain